MDRSTALARLRQNVTDGRPIIGGGAGTGISAKSAEAGGIDLIIIYNSGRYRMAGRGSLAGLLAYGDANAIVMEMASEVLPVRSEEHTSELQSRGHLVCRLLLEKKNSTHNRYIRSKR